MRERDDDRLFRIVYIPEHEAAVRQERPGRKHARHVGAHDAQPVPPAARLPGIDVDTADMAERKFWARYMDAYSEMFTATSTKWAPWYIIPADYKWIARATVADILTTTIRSLDLRYPKVTKEGRRALRAAKRELEQE